MIFRTRGQAVLPERGSDSSVRTALNALSFYLWKKKRRRKRRLFFTIHSDQVSRNAIVLTTNEMLGSGLLLENLAKHRLYPFRPGEHHKHGDDEERQADRAGKEGSDIAVGENERASQVLVQHVAQDYTQHQRRHGIIHLPQYKSHNAEEHHDANVEEPGLKREGSHHAEDEHDGHEFLPRYLEYLDHGTNHAEAQDKHGDSGEENHGYHFVDK